MKLMREKRHKRIRKKIYGTSDKPRMVVFRSSKHIYVQLVDDTNSKVITGCSSLSKEIKEKGIKTANKEVAKMVGLVCAQKAKKLGIETVSFDRAGYKYHGQVKSLADGAREGGLKF